MSQQINLLNPTLLTSKEWVNARMMAILAGITIMLMAADYGWTRYRVTQLADQQQAVTQSLASLKQQLDLARQQNAPRAPSPALQDDITLAEMTLKEHQQVLTFLQSGYFGNAQGFSGYMTAFARQSMKGLWLTDFSIDDSVSKIKISGRALRSDLVAQYISGLRQESILRGRDFSGLEMNAVAQPLATNAMPAMPVPDNLSAPSIPPTIIEFNLQSQEQSKEEKVATEANQSAAVGNKS